MLDKAIARGLNPQQMEAVQLLRGPVCILAGAGSGKTTTITRRIANQVRQGAFAPGEILAVTFTDKAAKEMVSRLQTLSVREVRARTFHAEALAQYRRYCAEPFDILGSKSPVLASLVQSLPPPYKFSSFREIATEIEWAKNRRLTPSTYAARLGEHEPPIPVDLMTKVFASYERRKSASRQIDFEDLLEHTIGILENNFNASQEVRTRYRAFTVDEYQDAADRAAAKVRAIHQKAVATDPFSGVQRRADEPELLMWIHATALDSFLSVHQQMVGDLTAEEADNYVSEMAVMAELLGLPPSMVPRTTSELALYMEGVQPSLAVTDEAKDAARWMLFCPPIPVLLRPAWLPVTAALISSLPPYAREMYGLPWIKMADLPVRGTVFTVTRLMKRFMKPPPLVLEAQQQMARKSA